MAASNGAFARIAQAFVDGYNTRDPEAWAAIFHPDCAYHPTVLVGSQTVYSGRDEIRTYIEELRENDRGQEARVNAIRPVHDELFVMSGEVLINGEVVSDATVIYHLKDGLIIHGKAYLTDDVTLDRLGMLPPGTQARIST